MLEGRGMEQKGEELASVPYWYIGGLVQSGDLVNPTWSRGIVWLQRYQGTASQDNRQVRAQLKKTSQIHNSLGFLRKPWFILDQFSKKGGGVSADFHTFLRYTVVAKRERGKSYTEFLTFHILLFVKHPLKQKGI